MPMAELKHHVLRTVRVKHPQYNSFCRKLALDRAIVAERPFCADQSQNQGKEEEGAKIGFDLGEGGGIAWDNRRVGRVVAFDEASGTHVVRCVQAK